MEQRSATLKEIARIAGVSTATVSRTLSHPALVAAPTRAAVLEAVAAMGYRVNHVARSLRRRRTGSVIALVPNLSNPFFSQILSGIAAVLSEADTGLLVADTRAGPDPDARISAYLAGGMADGLILLDGALATATLDVPGRPPVVCACEWLAGLPSVRVDNAAGARLAVRHLLAAGHRAIGHATGPRGNVLTETRLAGWRATLVDADLPAPDRFVFEGDFSLGSGARIAAAWRAMPDRPTAMFHASDEMAVGFVGALQHAGVAVPREVSVVGFDDIEVAQHVTPGLTTVRQPRMLIGERAARRLLALVEDADDVGTEVIPVALVPRGSVAPPHL